MELFKVYDFFRPSTPILFSCSFSNNWQYLVECLFPYLLSLNLTDNQISTLKQCVRKIIVHLVRHQNQPGIVFNSMLHSNNAPSNISFTTTLVSHQLQFSTTRRKFCIQFTPELYLNLLLSVMTHCTLHNINPDPLIDLLASLIIIF